MQLHYKLRNLSCILLVLAMAAFLTFQALPVIEAAFAKETTASATSAQSGSSTAGSTSVRPVIFRRVVRANSFRRV